MAHSQRGWTGARTPSAIKRVRQAQRRRAINQPRRSAAKTLVSKAVLTAGNGDAEQMSAALVAAVSALDKAAKIGAIHPNAAARRKSRLTLKLNAALGGGEIIGATKVARSTGKAAATKEAKARIAAGRATKAKGAQTAAGKARAALARSSREAAAEATTKPAEPKAPTTAAAKAPAKTAAAKTTAKTATKTTAKAPPKTAAKTTAKTAAKAPAKTATAKAAAKPPGCQDDEVELGLDHRRQIDGWSRRPECLKRSGKGRSSHRQREQHQACLRLLGQDECAELRRRGHARALQLGAAAGFEVALVRAVRAWLAVGR